MSYISVPLSKIQVRAGFECGKEPLDHYFRKQVSQDIKRKLCACFVLEGDRGVVKAYYTLSNSSIPLEEIPLKIRKKMPPAYKNLPTTLLGRLAVDKNFSGIGIGSLMLIDALKRSFEATAEIGSLAVVVDPQDQEAVSFYEKFGFLNLPDSGKLFLPMKTLQALFQK